MSFRDNLQHLRATRNMTQEQLAMLLGVSRQSVTKWEAEKSCPEMDKLLKMCQLFDCTLDELVQGDLTGRPRVEKEGVPQGAPQDICGYDDHTRAFAHKVAVGVAAILLGLTAGFLFSDSTDFALIGATLVGVIVALSFLVPAGMEHSAFVREHPFVEDFYTAEQKTAARSFMARGIVAGIGLILVGVIALIGLDEVLHARESLYIGAVLAFATIGVPTIIYTSIVGGRVNVDERNRNIADELEMEELVRADIPEDLKKSLVEKKRRNAKANAVCGAIMIAATIAGLVMLFGPILSSPDPDTFNPEGTPTMWFWLAWPIGGLLCAIVYTLMSAFGKKD